MLGRTTKRMLPLSVERSDITLKGFCVCVLWRNAKHAKVRGAQQHLEGASLTQRGPSLEC